MNSKIPQDGDAAGGPKLGQYDPADWLRRLRERVEAVGGAETIHIIEDEAPRLRRAAGGDLEPLEGLTPLDADQLNGVIDAILQGRGDRALEQTGETQMPLTDWPDARGGWWVAHIFKAERGRRRLLLRRFATAEEWLKE